MFSLNLKYNYEFLMKAKLKILAAIYVLFLQTETYSQWFVNFTPNPAQTSYTLKFHDQNTGWMTSILYNASTMNIYKTTNAGQNWVAQNSGFTAQRFMCIWIVDANTVYMCGNYGRIIKTTNGGANWDSLKTYTTNQLWGIQFVDANTGYVCGSNGLIMKTTNAGLNWFNQNSGVINAFSSIFFIDQNTGYISGSAIVIKTTNGGNNWQNMNAPYISGFENFREIKFTNANTGYYVSDMGRIIKTTNAGLNWELLNTGVSDALFAIHFTTADTAYVCGNAGKIIKTTNAGNSWYQQNSGLTEILTDVCFTNPSTGYISTWSGRILKTTNGGGTFNSINKPEKDDLLWLQNYPNPFKVSTTISYQLTSTGLTVLKIYDAKGKELKTLVNSFQNAGNYEILFDANDLTEGLYFYKLFTSKGHQSARMLLVK
jgi:photosystem II stability/assembly factor-like uncharacterized protein